MDIYIQSSASQQLILNKNHKTLPVTGHKNYNFHTYKVCHRTAQITLNFNCAESTFTIIIITVTLFLFLNI